MPDIASGIAQSMAGAPVTERIAQRAADKPVARKPKGRGKDELILDADAVDSGEGPRSLKSNDQEEAREDHQERQGYTKKGKPADAGDSPKLDVAG